MSKHNVTIYEGYPENRFRLLKFSLQRCVHYVLRVRWVCGFCGKAQRQFADIRTVSTHRVLFIMFKKIESPAAYEMRSVIHFLIVKNMELAEIHQLCDLYGEHAMSSSVLWRRVQQFNEGHKNVHDDLWSGRLSVVNEDLVCAFEGKLETTDDSPLHHFPCIFLKFHGHFFTKLCLVKLSFGNCVQTVCRRCIRKNTNWNSRPRHWNFWHNTVRKAKTSWAM